MREKVGLCAFFRLGPWSDKDKKAEKMEPIKLPPPSTTFWSRIADGLMCETCRRYRRGLAIVLGLALALWLSGRWG
jgi:hypothetical protein